MTPKKARELSKETANQLGVDETLVKDLTDFVWGRIQFMLSNMETTHLEILNLGSFKIKKWKLQETREKYIKLIPDYVPTTFKQAERLNSAKERLSRIENLIRIAEKDEQKRLALNAKRNEKKDKDNLEQPE